MTAIAPRPTGTQLWSTMPGWGIAADLTPPEVTHARYLRRLQRLLAVALAVVVLLCAAGYVYATLQRSHANDSYNQAEASIATLQAESAKYNWVPEYQSDTSTIESNVATLTAHDIDMAKLVADVRLALPSSMAITSLTVTSYPTGTAQGSSASLDTSDHAKIGQITINGTGQQLTDLAKFVAALGRLRGVTDVLPDSNALGTANTTTFSLGMSITDALYTHGSANTATSGGN